MAFRTARLARAGLVVAMTIASLADTGEALAAGNPATHVVAHVTPSTVRTGARFVVSGTASAKGGSVVVEHLVGRSWRSYGHAKVSAKGTYTLSVTAPKKAAVLSVRVVRAASKTAAAAISATLHVRATTAVYVVTAHATSTPAGHALVIAGTLRPKATGSVQLQVFTGTTWVAAGSTRLTAASTFSFSTTKPTGSYRFRVVKLFSKLVAGGISATTTGTVTPLSPISTQPTPPLTTAPPTTPPPAAPGPAKLIISTTTLPIAVATKSYAAQLNASGGTAPYTWSITSSQNWLHLSVKGTLVGIPPSPGDVTVSASVTDSNGQVATATLIVTVVHVSGTGRAWGSNNVGQLGDGTTSPQPSPVLMKGPSGSAVFPSIVTIAAGGQDTYILRTDGTVWAVGGGASGALGNGTYDNTATPVLVSGLTNVTAIAVGYNTVYALESDGTVWSWGDNSYGNLGTGAAVGNSSTPHQIPVPVGMKPVKAIAAGLTAGYALDTDGVVWSWGNNADGELGNGTNFASTTPTKVNGFAGMVAIAAGDKNGYEVSATGSVYGWGANGQNQLHYGNITGSLNPQLIAGVSGVRQLVSGSDMVYALGSNGAVTAWGDSNSGQMGDGHILSESGPVTVDLPAAVTVTSISATQHDGYAATSDGTVYSWGGAGNPSALGNNGGNVNQLTPAVIPGLTGVTVVGGGEESLSAFAVVYVAP